MKTFIIVLILLCASFVSAEYEYVAIRSTDGHIAHLDLRTYFQHPPPAGTYLPWVADPFDTTCEEEMGAFYDATTGVYSIPAWGNKVYDFGEAGGIEQVVDISDLSYLVQTLYAEGVWQGQFDCATFAHTVSSRIFQALLSNGLGTHQLMQANAMGVTLTVMCKTPATDAISKRCAANNNVGCDSYQITGYYPCDTNTYLSLLQLDGGQKIYFGGSS